MSKRHTRNQLGAHLAEFAGVLVVGLTLLVFLVFLALECARFYTIKSAMEVGARSAARALVVDYNKTATKGTSVTWLTMPSFIASDRQFTVTWDTASPPTYVTVTCAYPNDGSYGLPKFPGGPLSYINSVFNVKNVTVQVTFTVPVQ